MITSLDELRAGKVLRGEKTSMRVVSGTVRGDCDQVLYDLEKDEGIFLPAGVEMKMDVAQTLLSVLSPGQTGVSGPHRVRLADVPIQRTGDRWYRELIQSEITQFVGSIPPGRAPDHFHVYEEVLCVLKGSGFFWQGESKMPISAGSCVHIPPRQIHCVENTGSEELRLLGVFYPAGSPSVRYEVHDQADRAPSKSELDRRE